MPLRRPSNDERWRWLRLKPTREAVASISKMTEPIKREIWPKEDDFDSAVWRQAHWQAALWRAQHGLCAWCTTKVLGHLGAVDHIRPKSEVTRDLAAPGEEIDEAGRYRGRKRLPEEPRRPGYYHRAYDPNNFVWSCERCNNWKGTLWPVRPWHGPWSSPNPHLVELELVLNPFERGFDPLRHFRFGNGGMILPRHGDQRAEATIATLALDRPTLCEERDKRLRDLEIDMRAVRRDLHDAVLDPDRVPILCRVAKQCGWSSPHAAFYRAALRYVWAGMGGTWVQLRAAWDHCGSVDTFDEPPQDSWVA